MKKLLVCLLAVLLLAGCASEAEPCPVCEEPAKTVADLPAARDESKKYSDKDGNEVACSLTDYSVDCSSITAANFAEYANVEGVVYIDARDYKDFATKHMRNFECIPFFGLIYDEAADGSSEKPQLFKKVDGKFEPVYEESIDILHDLVPEDKTVFLMCQSGGRIKTFMAILDAAGYDMSKIYNIGGMAQYGEYEGITVAEDIVVNATYAFNNLTVK